MAPVGLMHYVCLSVPAASAALPVAAAAAAAAAVVQQHTHTEALVML